MNEENPKLDYARPAANAQSSARTALQGVAGVFSTFAMVGVVVLLLSANRRTIGFDVPPVFAIFGPLLALALLSVIAAKRSWRGFGPGVLIGLALTCLVPIGLVLVLCGGGRI